ncbi:Gfo/Idh/MocA family protein [Saccharopolyspora endophytica]|uniref:Gfo/Idh/MocA family oxidoreductase n=1 Tax=Saccharopolyspora endophytica TaxID=543886 RepID=A0ABS5DH83_9PSEU|nr:Gfo/Idh/MocA family oxidoreductase [Saccharopolyspora endophytica]MBQ0925640.1 Gfo/Idh/MocA family oxidoreductase [Saccharopolyspora endophytica]
MRTINVGLIGAGFMGKAHSLAYAAMPMFFWPAPAVPHRKIICDVTEEAAAEGAQRYGFDESTADWKRVVEHPDVEVVDIATPNNMHAEIAQAAAAAGKHIICEKPLARTAEEARTMYEAVRDAGVVNMVAFNYRRTPAVALAKRYIDEGAIGELISFRGTYLQDWSADPESPLSWRFQREIAGSGALGDIGTHVVDLARYLVGEISGVNAMLKTWVPERPLSAGGADQLGTGRSAGDAPRGPVDVDDELITMLRFSNGAIGSLEATRNGHGRNNFLTFELHGTEGSIVFNYERRDELQVCFASDGNDRKGFRTVYTGAPHPYGEALWPIPALGIGYGETKIVECHDLFQAITTQQAVSPDFGDGYQIARISDAIVESSETESWISVPPLDATPERG